MRDGYGNEAGPWETLLLLGVFPNVALFLICKILEALS